MPTTDLTAPNGWKKWVHPVTTISDIQLPDTAFPPLYTPASAFWIKSDLTHCVIPWLNVLDFISLFYLGGGASGTLIGSLGGLDVVQQLFNIATASATFGLTGSAAGPRFGFCIGNLFKQEAYISFMIQNSPYKVLLLGKAVEMTENGRFKRLYVHHGEVVNYVINDGEHVLTLDIDKTTPPPASLKGSVVGSTISTLDSKGVVSSLRINSLKDNWDIVVTPVSVTYPSSGDYYQLSPMWCIEDPYLLTGFWGGSENSTGEPHSSGYDLFLTDQNKSYQVGKILGVYIWKRKSSAPSTTTSGTPAPLVYQPKAGVSMENEVDYEWTFCGNGNSADSSDIYPNDTRYEQIRLDVPDPVTGATVQYITMPSSTWIDYYALIADPNTTFIRIEISSGGYYTRHNWYAPCLKGSYLNVAGRQYKILDHVEANIIDVSLKSIDSATLNIIENQSYSIFNQSAWMTSEYYFQNMATTANIGLFEASINSISSNKVVAKTLTMLPDALLKKGGVSIVDRCLKTVSLPSSMKAMYAKQQGWMMVTNTSEYTIDNVIFEGPDSNNSYLMTITLDDTPSDLKLNQRVYITLGVPYDTVYPFSRRAGYSLELTLDGGLKKGSAYITSDVLCLDGQYKPAPYKIEIPPDTRIGICDGYLFGIEANGSAQSRIGVLIFATVPRTANGIASLFHALRQEDWIIYQDAETQNMTIRKGSLDFKEYPSKDEVVVGKPKYISPASIIGSGNEIVLDSSKERLRRLLFNVQNIESKAAKPAITFGVGSPGNAYGFLVSGKGLVDLQMLRYQGIGRGDTSSSKYVDTNGESVSPVYTYKISSVQNLQKTYVDMGTGTDKNIFVNDGIVSNAVAQYVNNNQVLTAGGLFDIIKLGDGEAIILYGQSVKSFNLYNENHTGSKLNNSSNNSTQWFNPNAVFMISSFNDTYFWGTPSKIKEGSNDDTKYQYPIMLLNSVEYVGCIYNPNANSICIFVRAFRGNTSYLGCFKTTISTLTHSLFECEDPSFEASAPASSPLKFLYRPVLMDDSFIADSSKSWIRSSSDIVQDYYSFTGSTEDIIKDQYINVLSSTGQVIYGEEFGIISTNILYDGTYVVFYDTNSGIRAVFSPDQGYTWVTSYLIYSRSGRSGLMLGDKLFYITESGIEVKMTYMADFYDDKEISMKRAEGIDVTVIERNKQRYIDTLATIPIGSGIIDYQRLSGYVTPEGITKIFFYDANQRLKCMESSDGRTWIVADNF